MNQDKMNQDIINQEVIIIKDLILENKYAELNNKLKELFNLIEIKQGKYCNYKRSKEYYELEENIIKFIESSDDILFDTQTLSIICDNFKNIGSSIINHCYRKICSNQMPNQMEIPDQMEISDQNEISYQMEIPDQMEISDQNEISYQMEIPDQMEMPDQMEILYQYKINNNLMLTTYILENYIFEPMFLVMFIHKIFAIVPNGTVNIGLKYCVENFVLGIINNSSYSQNDKKIILNFCDEVCELKNMNNLSKWIKKLY